MSSKTIVPAIAITRLSSLAIGSAGFAEEALPAHPANQSRDITSGTSPSSHGPGMMGDASNMPEMMNMMRQMTRMMENCNHMMESAAQKPPAPEKPPVPQTPRG